MNHTHTLLTYLLERANNSVKRTDIPLSPRVSRLPQTSEYYKHLSQTEVNTDKCSWKLFELVEYGTQSIDQTEMS